METKIPSREEFECAMIQRHTRPVYEKLRDSRVAVAGLGGLGSNIAISLARAGVGEMLLVDFDTVDITNLNRQQYDVYDIGRLKTEALRDRLAKINPYTKVVVCAVKVTEENAPALFGTFGVVCEAFDRADQKAMLVNSLLENCPDTTVVSSSGMAGALSSNTVVTRRITRQLYMCGDGVTDAADTNGLMAPRVAVCANHAANTATAVITYYTSSDTTTQATDTLTVSISDSAIATLSYYIYSSRSSYDQAIAFDDMQFYAVVPVKTAGDISVSYQTADGTVIGTGSTISSANYIVGDTASYYFPLFVKGTDGNYYKAVDTTGGYEKKVTFTADAQTSVVTYALADGVVYYTEGESFVDNSSASSVYSNGSTGHLVAFNSIAGAYGIGTYSAGKYTAYAYLSAGAGRGLVLRDSSVSDMALNTLAAFGTDTTGKVIETSFVLTGETTLKLTGRTAENGKTNQSADFDYIYIVKTGDYTAPTYTTPEEVSTGLDDNTAGDSVYARAFTFTANPNDGSYSNVIVAIGETSNSVSDTVVSGTGDIVYGIIVSSTDADKVNAVTSDSFTITLN